MIFRSSAPICLRSEMGGGDVEGMRGLEQLNEHLASWLEKSYSSLREILGSWSLNPNVPPMPTNRQTQIWRLLLWPDPISFPNFNTAAESHILEHANVFLKQLILPSVRTFVDPFDMAASRSVNKQALSNQGRFRVISLCPFLALYLSVPSSLSISLSLPRSLSLCPFLALYLSVPSSLSVSLFCKPGQANPLQSTARKSGIPM